MFLVRTSIALGVVGFAEVAAIVIATIGIYQAAVPGELSGFTAAQRLGFAALALGVLPAVALAGIVYRWIDPHRPWRRALVAFGLSATTTAVLTVVLYFVAYAVNDYGAFLIAGWLALGLIGAAINVALGRRTTKVERGDSDGED